MTSRTRIPRAELTGICGAVVKRMSRRMLGDVAEPVEVTWHNRTTPDVADDVELAENVSIAMLTVLETLGPVERAVFVLHEVRAARGLRDAVRGDRGSGRRHPG